ncbi:MAG: restriction endonuclease [Nitrosopumilus sp.]|nr:restriction endonuclease [Nitrosopumilus sp.]MDH5727397.1 restriction endonuclease [Gammaproteobacteria bacterium]
MEWIKFAVIGICALLFFLLSQKNSHWRKIRKANAVIKKLRSFNGENIEGRVIGYLRKIDPFVFEELILNAFKERGVKILRNRRYTGDGGIDSRIIINDQPVFIQAKRYQSHINQKHVTEFGNLIARKKVQGLFVHTGKTGKGSREESKRHNITMISGSLLTNLVLGKPLRIFQNDL